MHQMDNYQHHLVLCQPGAQRRHVFAVKSSGQVTQ